VLVHFLKEKQGYSIRKIEKINEYRRGSQTFIACAPPLQFKCFMNFTHPSTPTNSINRSDKVQEMNNTLLKVTVHFSDI
jgi:hypothetical protein